MCPWTHLESSFLSISTFFLIPCFKLHPTSLVTWNLCILWRYFIQRLKDSLTRCHLFEKQSFCCVSIYCLSRWSPKAGSLSSDWCSMLPGEQGPCVVRPLLCVHNDPLPSLLCRPETETGAVSISRNLWDGFYQSQMDSNQDVPCSWISGVQRLFFNLSSLRSTRDQNFDRNRDFFPHY